MSCRKVLLCLGMFIFYFGMVCNVRAATKTVQVDCMKGQSINEKLKEHPDKLLIIEIDGMCEEDVFVRRYNVILRGINSEIEVGNPPVLIPADGIQAISTDPDAPPPFGAALEIREAANVTVDLG